MMPHVHLRAVQNVFQGADVEAQIRVGEVRY